MPFHADEPKNKRIDAETIAAYEKAVAKYGYLLGGQFGYSFSAGEGSPNETPAFSFAKFPDRKAPKLPPITVPFALFLHDTEVGDEGLKELKDLKTLTYLDLDNTGVGTLGLKQLKDLNNLTHLYLGNTKVSDAGLKELKDLNNLTHLSGPFHK